MAFNKEEYSANLDTYQGAISLIRESRSDGKKILLDQRHTWRNSVLTICFGIAAAFFAAGPNITFASRHREIMFWVSALLFLFVGLFVMIYVKNKLDSDSNELSTIMMEQEYYLLKVRNLYREALAGQKEVDQKLIQDNIASIKQKSSEVAKSTIKNSKKIQIVDDLWTIILIFAFYFLGFSFVPLHKARLGWYVVLGVLLVISCATYFVNTFKKAKTTNKDYRVWRKKLDDLTY